MRDTPQPPKPTFERVKIGKLFQIFPQDSTQKRFTPVGKTNIYDRNILLDTNGLLPELPIRLYAGATHVSGSNAVSPYTDAQPHKDHEKEIDYTSAPLCLDASIHGGVLRSMKLTKHSQTLPDRLLPEVHKKLSRLRYHIMLPKRDTFDLERPIYDTFVARPDETSLLLGELSFRLFTKEKLPSLHIPKPNNLQVTQGYFLMIPSEDKIIQKMQGQFSMGK